MAITITIQDEVKQNQIRLRERLQNALTEPPKNLDRSLLPEVPVIDLSSTFSSASEASQQVVTQIRDACITTGFFQVVGHGINDAVCEAVLLQAERFFRDLNSQTKDALHIKHSSLYRGYEPPEATYVNPDDDPANSTADSVASKPETKEGFNFGYEASLDPTGGDGAYVELDGTIPHTQPDGSKSSNLWPAEDVLPGFKSEVGKYYGEVLGLARHLIRLFALALGLKEDYFDDVTTHPGGITRLLYYPPHAAISNPLKDSQSEDSSLGLGAHTDYEMFTILLTRPGYTGLEILFPPSPLTNNRPLWQQNTVRKCLVSPDRPLIEKQRACTYVLTINVADFLQRWTNDIFKSAIHRVVMRAPQNADAPLKPRYSVPFFFSINYDAEVAPLPIPASILGPSSKAAEGGHQDSATEAKSDILESKYQPMKAGEYILARLQATTSSI